MATLPTIDRQSSAQARSRATKFPLIAASSPSELKAPISRHNIPPGLTSEAIIASIAAAQRTPSASCRAQVSTLSKTRAAVGLHVLLDKVPAVIRATIAEFSIKSYLSSSTIGFVLLCPGYRGRPRVGEELFLGEPSTELRRRLRSHMRLGNPVHSNLTAPAYLSRVEGRVTPEPQTHWQETQRSIIDQIDTGEVLKSAVRYQRIAQKFTLRDSH